MNTPAHVVFSLVLLGRPNAWRYAVIISIGALLPDTVMFVFYAWHKVAGTPESVIWSQSYYKPGWQNLIDLFNSIPLIGLALIYSCWRRNNLFALLFSSMLAHCLLDLPVHHDDAHRHFYPFSNWRFESPLSYWDRNHYGGVVGALEVSGFIIATIWLWRFHPSSQMTANRPSRLRLILIATLLVYAIFFWFVYRTWA